MPGSQDNSNSPPLDQKSTRQLHELCTKLYDNVITADELAEFNRLLERSPDARQFYLRYVSLHSLLLGSVSKQERVESELLGCHIDSNANLDLDTLKKPNFPSIGKRHFVFGAGIVVAMVIVASATFWILRGNNDQLAVNPPNSSSTPSATAAHVSYISSAARWQIKNDISSSGDSLNDGDVVNLADGEVELTYLSGTKLLVIGPAEFHVHDVGGKLIRGGIIASVTEEGHGFTIDLPDGKVVDLGTEFGVAVDDFGISEVNVFDGKVEAFPSSAATEVQKFELFEGDGVQWNQGKVKTLDADLRKFATSVLGRQIVLSKQDGGHSRVDRFRDAELDSAKWKRLGNVRPSEDGLVMTGSGSLNDRPYLVSTEQFNPLLGAVTIACEFQFSEISPNDSPAFSIMTRSAGVRSDAPKPWQGFLASCVSCGFSSADDSQEGLLKAGVKLEPDREMVNVSWSGFESPTPETRYRIVMCDDGVNVSFTLSLVENPAKSKTVTFRSLFNGNTNYVAMGGSVVGSTIVQRFEISQPRSSAKLSSYAEFCSLLRVDPAQQKILRRQLDDLAPEDAKLILQDDFSGATLDRRIWKSLGSIALRDGVAQLGESNDTAHVDTWKARPYLLARKPLDPNDGQLTITGVISFADNFLDGYGASFAVMTRAADTRGSGPGWENSVLQLGVRANFWPASYDQNHSLEIHEKPNANTITLLAKRGMEVEPFTRTYLFRVVDDGQSITMTIVDPKRPKAKMEITSPTTAELESGFIAFESCWGSPIKLDHVQIYQSISSPLQNSESAEDE